MQSFGQRPDGTIDIHLHSARARHIRAEIFKAAFRRFRDTIGATVRKGATASLQKPAALPR